MLELVPGQLAAAITERLSIPTIGIGAGAGCSGQIQVITDTLGWGDWTPKHARRYADLHGTILEAVSQYKADVEAGTFPADAETVLMDPAVLDEVLGRSVDDRARRGRRTRGDPARPRPLASPTRVEVVRTRAELRAALAAAPRPVGFVPTMGWLHAGHTLADGAGAVARTRPWSSRSSSTRASSARRRTSRSTRATRRATSRSARRPGVDIVFAPPVDEVYVPGFDTTVTVGAIAGPLEGAARPGHFDGVATVVAILLSLVGAERAYFGLKDYQQVRVIRRMALDLALPTEIVALDTVREPDGLAMSSRNARLSPAGRAAAPVIRRALLAGAACVRGGERDAAAVRSAISGVLATEPLADPDYVSVADPESLEELATIGEAGALLSTAVRIEGVRLIDNERVG